jgi:hypothetical protein
LLAALALKTLLREMRTAARARRLPRGVLPGAWHRGYCPICEARTIFVIRGPWLRDQYLCARCRSIPRWRALIEVLETHFPRWRDAAIHESSPGGAASNKLQRECRHYASSHFFPDTPPGQVTARGRCEDLERLTFGDAIFDLVVTQDVLEHVLDPARAFAEVARTLKPGGAHVFTVPWYQGRPTRQRARRAGGAIEHLEPPEYHGNPIDPNGSLVVTDWGWDLCDVIYRHCGLTTTAIKVVDRSRGIVADFNEVFVTRKLAPAG